MFVVVGPLKIRCLPEDIHFWLGNETSIDEAGSAAMLTVMLDHILGGGAVQHREIQYSESSLFKSYFKKQLEYLPGGVKSGMNYVAELDIPRRLFLIKGRSNAIASQVGAGTRKPGVKPLWCKM